MATIPPHRFFVRLTGGDASDGMAAAGELERELIGGKARSVRELAALGLPVPPAFAVTTELLASLRAGGPALPDSLAEPNALNAVAAARRTVADARWPVGFAEKLTAELGRLGGAPQARFSVRSSADVEDQGDALAAGLFLSCTDVSRGDVLQAIGAVLLSALSPAVVAYFAGRGLPASGLRLAVLIHPFVAGEASGTAALDPAAPEPLLIDTVLAPPPPGARQRLEAALRAVVADHGPSEIEWVATGDDLVLLQLRPFRRRKESRRRVDAGSGAWRWDAAHNPLPLSPAQAGLVAIVDERCRTGLRQKVEGGYLFFIPEPVTYGASDPSAPELGEMFRELAAGAAKRLSHPDPTLDTAIDEFVAIYEPLFGAVQQSARRHRTALSELLRRYRLDPAPLLPPLLADVPSAATRRARRARAIAGAPSEQARRTELAAYLDEFGDESPSWDVSAPTWRETPDRLAGRLGVGRAISGRTADARATADDVARQLPPDARAEWAATLARARAAAAVAEDDDWLYARMQAHVRRALLREGARLVASGVLPAADHIFWLPLETVRRQARGEAVLTAAAASTLVEEARRADAAARAAPPSLTFSEASGPDERIIRGRSGAGGAHIGRVRHHEATAERDDAPGDVLVARTLLPTELPLLSAAALVVETGGPLDHVAAQARERGIPAVVGAADACSRLRDGDSVLVDGDAGVVVRLT